MNLSRAVRKQVYRLCLTVDTPVAGNRERDFVHGMSMPPKFGLKSLWSFATHPGWASISFATLTFGFPM